MQNLLKQRKSALAKIHLGKKQLGLDEESYRAMLRNIGGVSSSKELDSAGLDKVLKHLSQCGAVFNKSVKRAGTAPRNLKSTAATAPLMQKIGALLAELGLPWDYALGIARQMYKKEALEFCSGHELWAVTNALIQKKHKAEEVDHA